MPLQRPASPACLLTTWVATTRSVRLCLPITMEADASIGVGTIGPGWMELTDDETAPRLEIEVEQQTRNRIALRAGGYLHRFGATPGEPVLIRVTGAGCHHLIQVLTLDRLDRALQKPKLRPSRLFPAPGWDRWRAKTGSLPVP